VSEFPKIEKVASELAEKLGSFDKFAYNEWSPIYHAITRNNPVIGQII